VLERRAGGRQRPGDVGAADPVVAAALAAYASGTGSEHAATTALAAARLLVPVVAIHADDATGSRTPGEKVSEMALPTLVGNDGRIAVLAFTCLDSLSRWRPDARPVPVPAQRVWQAAAQEASAVVIDVAGPVPLALDGARLAALAGGRPVPLPHEDPDVQAAAEAAVASEPLLTGGTLAGPGDDSDLALQVTLAAGCDAAQAGAAVRRAVAGLMAATGGRLRRGVEVAVVAAGRTGGRR
jgi:SseB protein N-terminal domain